MIRSVSRLEPCWRPFCCGAAALHSEEGFHWIECQACGAQRMARRDPSALELAALVADWNKVPDPAAEALPAFLRAQAASAFGEARLNLLDAAELIERQAAVLARRVAS